MNQNDIFLSYASQDVDAAARICDALRAGGLEVWFDQSELRGGDAWDASIRKQIKECALFVPLISANTDERSEGYFRLEWKLAVDRSHLMADDQSFLLPVVIDETPEATARVPDRFHERQWTLLPGGNTPPEFVERVRRLLAGVTARAPQVVPGQVGHASNRIAVLPFQNLSGRAEDAYLADGLHEEILNALAKFRDFKVISRTSVMEYRDKVRNVREIGQRLGVGTVLEGSIRRDGNTLRLTVQLINTRDDHHLLATNYDRELKNVLDLQSTVARQVATALAATLTRHERGELDRVATNSGDAYDRYLRATASFRMPTYGENKKLSEPKRLLEEALRFDPDYADALAMLSRANTWDYLVAYQTEDAAAARRACERALALQPDLPEAKLARGLYTMYIAKDPGRALADLDDAVKARPSNAVAHQTIGLALRRLGRFDEALAHQVVARDLDTLNDEHVVEMVLSLLGLRRYPEAIEETQKASRRFPNNPDSYFTRARIEAFLQKGAEPLRATLRDHGNLLDEAGRKTIGAEIATAEGRYLDAVKLWADVPSSDPVARAERTGILYLAAGNSGRAEQSFREAERIGLDMLKREPERVELADVAIVQSMLGKHAAALATIETEQLRWPESRDKINGPVISLVRSFILVRAGRNAEGYAEVTRLVRVPFSAPYFFNFSPHPVLLLLKDDPHYDELLNHPPRL